MHIIPFKFLQSKENMATRHVSACKMTIRPKSITIPESVTEIGNKAFYLCTSLKKANTAGQDLNIGSNAFFYTPWLDEQKEKNLPVILRCG